MKYEAINLADKFSRLDEAWQPRVIAELNDYQFKVVRLDGEFVWHKHDDTDEAFLVLDGEMRIEFRDGMVEMKKGELFVVPRGLEHKPVTGSPCRVLLIEPRGVPNTGDAGGDRTARGDVWI